MPDTMSDKAATHSAVTLRDVECFQVRALHGGHLDRRSSRNFGHNGRNGTQHNYDTQLNLTNVGLLTQNALNSCRGSRAADLSCG